jgi:RND family efflux transporter MFP subunit
VIRARVEADLGFRVPGKLADRLVDLGAHVRQGQALARLDPQDYALALAAAEAQARSAQAQADRAASDERRLRGLVQSGAVSPLTYDQVRAAADSSAAQAVAAVAQRDVARRQSGYSVLTADADGVITSLSADVGQVIAAGQPVMRLAHDGPREAVVDTPEVRRGSLPRQSRAVMLARAGGVPVAATLRQVAAAADPQTRTFEARYVLDGTAADAPLGSSVRLELPRPAAAASGVLVPLGAVVDRGHGAAVFVLDRTTLTVHRRGVTVASLAEESARITAGLQSGETVVALGVVQLQDGQHIRLEMRP